MYVFALCGISASTVAQTDVKPAAAPAVAPATAKAWDSAFESLSYDKDGNTLPYRFLKPAKVEAGKTYPLLIFLHGAGERGTDNKAQMKHSVSDIVKIGYEKNPFFMIVPQCPKNRRWVEVDWGANSHTMPETPSIPFLLLFDVIYKVSKDFPVDPKRIYVMGISMGGFGTWDAISRSPDLFAAAIPVCGGADTVQAAKLAKFPIWVFHGGNDTTVKTKRSRDMVEAIKKAGGDPKYTEYPGVGHGSWAQTFSNPEVIEWLFTQVRK
ncbi:MAG: phospholipase [Lentisphaerae bacterium GWF2_49_21]|nr:MAG: phospholipase [Lentisphaerae bacterium GWF2_49_21]